MERLHYSRAALLLGFVLGDLIERYFLVSLKAHGPFFFMRPIALAIIALVLLAGDSGPRITQITRRREKEDKDDDRDA